MILENKLAICTGGGRGIGRATALKLASEGADIVIASRTQKELDEVRNEILEKGRKVESFCFDISDRSAAQCMVERVINDFGRIDILVNCAGILEFGSITEVSSDQFERIFDINVKGAMHISQAVLPIMKKQRHGNIVMVSAIGSQGGGGKAPVYRASKAALNSIAEAFAEETLGTGVRVNTICPCEVKTRMSDSLGREDKDKNDWMDPEDIADIILFFVSNQSRAVTGATLLACGKNRMSRWG